MNLFVRSSKISYQNRENGNFWRGTRGFMYSDVVAVAAADADDDDDDS